MAALALTPGLPRSFSETSFLLISPLQAPLRDLFAPSKWLYSLPALAAADALATIILGVLIAGKEELDLVAWGLTRAAVVGWVGWGRGVRRGGSGGGGWVAATSMISLLLVFWQLNLLFQTRSPAHRPPRPPTPSPNATTTPSDGTNDFTTSLYMHAGDPFHGRGLEPHYVFLLTTTLFAFLEYVVFLSLNRLLPPPPHTPRAGAFAIRTPKQFPSPHPHQTTSISSSGPSATQTHPSHFLNAQRHRSHPSPSTIRPNPDSMPDLEASGFYSDDDDGDSDISDSEIVDIAPSRAAEQQSESEASREGPLERSLSRSFSRRSRLVAQREEREGGYGTFEGGREEPRTDGRRGEEAEESDEQFTERRGL